MNSAFYWRDLAAALGEFHRVLATGGRVVLCLIHRKSLEHKRFARHGLKLYVPEDLIAALGKAGFEQVTVVPGADRHREFFCALGTRTA